MLPSWVNEKEEGVGVNTVVWGSSFAATVIYAAVGWMGGLAFADIPDNMLELLASPSASGPLTRVCALLFGVAIIGLGIPIFCILMRYNLVVGGVCGNGLGTFLGGVLPWLVSWLVYQGHGVLELLSWTGLVLNGFIDFFCPALVALVAVRWVMHRTYLPVTGGGLVSDRSRTTAAAGELPPTVVNALPKALRQHHERFVLCLSAAIIVVVGSGLLVKSMGTVKDATG